MLVSIYLPTHNRVDLLHKAVNSVLAQAYRNIELIVVNDASTDGTDEYLRQKAKEDTRLVFFKNAETRGAQLRETSQLGIPREFWSPAWMMTTNFFQNVLVHSSAIGIS